MKESKEEAALWLISPTSQPAPRPSQARCSRVQIPYARPKATTGRFPPFQTIFRRPTGFERLRASTLFRRDGAEEAMCLIVKPGSEEEGVRVPGQTSIPERQSPQAIIVIALPLSSRSWPRKAPVTGSKALMRPSPKLPTSTSVLNVPKSAPATDRPGYATVPTG